jgi:alanyl-tRNA synthetase
VGESARQAGSLVTPEGLRFDFPFDRALTTDEKRAIEAEVRRVIRDDRPVSVAHLSMAEAIEAGADAFFDEKYGETVRTVRVEGFSHELCGGTHCRASGQIGGFVITGERSIGSGVRRIEAVTGEAAEALVDSRLATLDAAVAAAGVQAPDALPARVVELQERIRELEKRIRAGATSGGGMPRPGELAKAAESVGGTLLAAFAGAFPSMDEVKGYAKDVRGALPSGVIAIALDADEPQLFVTVSDDLVARGIGAGDLVRAAAPAIDGKGGGRPEMAQGRGTRRDGVPAALAAIRDRLSG